MSGENTHVRNVAAGNTMLNVATYNVHGWTGMDSHQLPQRTLDVLQEMNCDIVGLQEATFSLGNKKYFSADYIRKTTCMEPVLGPTLYKSPLYFGNILLTRLPVHEVCRHDLSVSTFEPRGALDVMLSHKNIMVRVMVTHLGLKIRERRRQMKLLLEKLGDKGEDYIILMGDFNEWFLTHYAYWKLHSMFGFVRSPRTFPSIFPLFAIDRIWVHPAHALVKLHAWRSELTRIASDHLPVQAVISLP